MSLRLGGTRSCFGQRVRKEESGFSNNSDLTAEVDESKNPALCVFAETCHTATGKEHNGSRVRGDLRARYI